LLPSDYFNITAMKRIKIVLITLLLSLISLPLVTGQEKKSEQKIKIVVADESGSKVLIDTVCYDSSLPDSIQLKDGKIVFIGRGDNETRIISRSGRGHTFVIVSPEDEGIRKESRIITIVSSDSIKWIAKPEESGEQVFIYSDRGTRKGRPGIRHEIIADAEKDIDSDTEMTRIVIAKDGIVVSVEGSDEARVKEIAKEIENKLDIKKEDTVSKTVVKETQTKAVKKK